MTTPTTPTTPPNDRRDRKTDPNAPHLTPHEEKVLRDAVEEQKPERGEGAVSTSAKRATERLQDAYEEEEAEDKAK
jgi:hypothetical protein